MAYGFTYTLPVSVEADFPVLLKTADFPSAALDGTANSLTTGGGEIKAYTSDAKTTQLPVHVVSLTSSGSPAALVWVKLISAGASIYIEKDSVQTSQPAANTTYGSENVWTTAVLSSIDGTTDDTSNGNDATEEGGITAGGGTGTFGVATDFDGSNDYLDVTTETNLAFTDASDFSMFVWIKSADQSRSIIIGDWNGSPSTNLEIQTDGKIRAYLDSTGEIKNYNSTNVVDDDAWHRIGLTYEGTGQTLKLFIDGVSETVTKNNDNTLSGSFDNSNTLRFGSDNRAGGHPYDGLAHGFYISDNELTENWVGDEYDNQSSVSAWGTVGTWADAGGDTNVSVTTDALIITEQAAVVNAETNALATTDVLVITEYQSTVALDASIAATSSSLVLTPYSANINAETNVNATTDALVVTPHNASTGAGTNVAVTTDSLVITEYASTVNAETSLNVTTDSLVLTEHNATVTTGFNVNVTTDSLVITGNAASVNAETNVRAVTDSLILTTFTADVVASVPDFTIDGLATKTINAAYGSLKIYGNGENWFTI